MSIIGSNVLAGAAGGAAAGAADYQIERSLRFNSGDSAYLNRTPSSAGNRKTWTWAGWMKRSALGTGQCIFSSGTNAGDVVILQFANSAGNPADTINLYSHPASITTTQVFRDISAWYHIVWTFDTTQATAANRSRLYVNGVEVTGFSGTYPTQNADYGVNASGVVHNIGRYTYDSTRYFSGYLADVHFIDGQALDPTSFTETDANGVLQPKAYSGGSYGTNGFHLDFSDNSTASALGTDTSGNSNTWTVNNISVATGSGNDSLVDTPTNYSTDTGAGGEVRGNYCTFNSVAVPLSGTHVLSNGNLDVSTNSGNIIGTYFLTSGKWYWEVNAGGYVGICGKNGVGYTGSISVSGSDAYGYWNNGRIYSGVGSYVTGGSTFTSSDTIGVALDMDGGTVKWYKNNVLQYNLALNYSNWEDLRGGVFPCINGGGGSSLAFAANFGQRPFAYTAPSSYKALCTQNLPTPTIADGSTVMDVALYTGNGSTQTISGFGFSPDLVWNKARSSAYGHTLFDSVRGSGKYLASESTAAESDLSPNGLTSFNSNGWTESAVGGYNANGTTYVAWAWDAGSSTVSNTDGSITSSVRANASAGFSIVTYTGTGTANSTIGHGLGVAPSLIITKNRGAVNNWYVYHASLGVSSYLSLDTTGAAGTLSNYWNPVNSTVFGQPYAAAGPNNGSQVAYCFAPVDGYSSFGSYTGNGSTDGSFVHTGFRPRWILIKSSNSIEDWKLYDTARDSYNLSTSKLYPNISAAENGSSGETASTNTIDVLSNGFKLRTSNSGTNSSSITYIYAAFAENPFQTARAR